MHESGLCGSFQSEALVKYRSPINGFVRQDDGISFKDV